MGTVILSIVAVVVPTLAALFEWMGGNAISERHHSRHDTYVLSPAFTRAIVFAMAFMGLTGLVLGLLCELDVFDANPVVVLSFFVSFVVVMLVLWAFVRRYKVSLFESQMIVTPLVGGDVTIGYDDIDSMEWTGLRKGSGYRDLAVYVGGHRTVLSGVLDLEQVLMRIDRYDVLGRNSSL